MKPKKKRVDTSAALFHIYIALNQSLVDIRCLFSHANQTSLLVLQNAKETHLELCSRTSVSSGCSHKHSLRTQKLSQSQTTDAARPFPAAEGTKKKTQKRRRSVGVQRGIFKCLETPKNLCRCMVTFHLEKKRGGGGSGPENQQNEERWGSPRSVTVHMIHLLEERGCLTLLVFKIEGEQRAGEAGRPQVLVHSREHLPSRCCYCLT